MNWNKILGVIGVAAVLTFSYSIIPEIVEGKDIPVIILIAMWSLALSIIFFVKDRPKEIEE